MSPKQWGPPIWTLFHCIAEKIKEDKFRDLRPHIFSIIKKICSNLPCPDCTMHATNFISKVNFSYIVSKDDFRKFLYIFHNVVNRRKKKPLFNVLNLEKYSKINLIEAFNNFVNVYHTNGNMKLLADSFQRKILVKDLKNWFMTNYTNFDN